MKKAIFILASIFYVIPYQFNLILSGPDIALVLSLILILLLNPLEVFGHYINQFSVLGRLISSLILFQVVYIAIFFFHGGSFPNESLSDSLIRAVRSLYPFISMAVIAMHVFVLPKFININTLRILFGQATILSVVAIVSLLNIFGCVGYYGGICLLNQSGYSATGFMSLSAIILLLLSLTTNQVSTGPSAQLRKLVSSVSLCIFLYLLINAGSRAAVGSFAVFVMTSLFLGYVKPLLFKGFLSVKSTALFISLSLFVSFYLSSHISTLRAMRIFLQLMQRSDQILGNDRASRYYSFDRLTSDVTSFFGSGNFSYQPNPLGTSWYDGTYIWFQNNYGLPGLITLFFFVISLFLLIRRLLRADSLHRKKSHRPSVECIISISAIFSFVVANSAQEVFALNTISPFTIYVLSLTAYISLLRSRLRHPFYEYA